jgi:hypothetical protein
MDTAAVTPVPTGVLRPVLWEIADIVEQTFAIACESLYPTANDRHAATRDYRAERRLTKTRIQDVLRSKLAPCGTSRSVPSARCWSGCTGGTGGYGTLTSSDRGRDNGSLQARKSPPFRLSPSK